MRPGESKSQLMPTPLAHAPVFPRFLCHRKGRTRDFVRPTQVAMDVLRRHKVHLRESLGVLAAGCVVGDRLTHLVQLADTSAEAEVHRFTFGPEPVTLPSTPEMLRELIQEGFEEEAIAWLSSAADSADARGSLASWRGVGGQHALHVACACGRTAVLGWLLDVERWSSRRALLRYMRSVDRRGFDGLAHCGPHCVEEYEHGSGPEAGEPEPCEQQAAPLPMRRAAARHQLLEAIAQQSATRLPAKSLLRRRH